MSVRESIIVGLVRKIYKDGTVTVYKGLQVKALRNRLDKEGVVYKVERRVRSTPGAAPGACRCSTTTNVSQVMGYLNSGRIHEEYMLTYMDSLQDPDLRGAVMVALDRSQNSEVRMNALRQLNDAKHLVCMARLKKMKWVFTKEDDVVIWPGQSWSAAIECKMYRYGLRQTHFYDLRAESQMQIYSDDTFKGHLVTLIRMANLGDWIAAEILSSEELIPESQLPDPNELLQLIDNPPNQYCLMAYAVYTVRRWPGNWSLAEKFWERCRLPQAAVQLALSRAKDDRDLMRMLQSAPECRAKDVEIAIEKQDGDSLLKLDDCYNAGLAYARAGTMDIAKQLLLEEAKNRNEAGSRMLLAAVDPLLAGDPVILSQLNTLHGKRELAYYMVRHGDRQGAIALLRQLGIMGAKELVAMGEMSQGEYDVMIQRLQSTIKFRYLPPSRS
jgi:hypothetical protein